MILNMFENSLEIGLYFKFREIKIILWKMYFLIVCILFSLLRFNEGHSNFLRRYVE